MSSNALTSVLISAAIDELGAARFLDMTSNAFKARGAEYASQDDPSAQCVARDYQRVSAALRETRQSIYPDVKE